MGFGKLIHLFYPISLFIKKKKNRVNKYIINKLFIVQTLDFRVCLYSLDNKNCYHFLKLLQNVSYIIKLINYN
jgi:hypothetical protein